MTPARRAGRSFAATDPAPPRQRCATIWIALTLTFAVVAIGLAAWEDQLGLAPVSPGTVQQPLLAARQRADAAAQLKALGPQRRAAFGSV